MRVVISTKDSIQNKLELDVACWFHDYGAFHFVMSDGTVRVYPDTHIWYVEQPVAP